MGIVPADGKPRGIRLRAQSVNAVITEDATGVWADTDLEVQLQNRGKTPVALPVGLPGPQASAYVTNTPALPQILDVTLDKKPLILSPVSPGETTGIRASAMVTIPVQGTVAIRVRYRQAVPVRDDLAAYVYPLVGGNVWAGAPETLDVVVTFKPPVSADQVMHVAAGSRAPRPGVYRWTWNGVKAPSNVGAGFVTNAWWRGLAAAREAAAAPGAGLAEHAELAERYWRLATLNPPAFAPGASFYEQAFPLAVAAWRAGILSPGPAASPGDLARARERLAGLYLAEGSRAGSAASQPYLQLAVDELAAAAALDPGNADLAASATALQERLAQAASGRGDGVLASVHSSRLRAIAAGLAAPSDEQDAQQRALTLAAAAVAAGDLAGARGLIQEAFGPEALELPNARPPAITQSLVSIRSRRDSRDISLHLIDGAVSGSAAMLIQDTAASLRRVAPVLAAGNALTVTLAYTDPVAMLAAQHKLAAALPRLPELALLSSALTSRRLAWPEDAGLLTRTSRYEERVDLSRSVAVWDAEAGKLGAAAGRAAQSNEALDGVRAALWQADARAWRDLGPLSRATYTVELQEQGAGPEWLQARVHQFYLEGSIGREWLIRAGETRQVEAAVLGWRYDRVALAAGAAGLLAVLAVVLLWSVSR